MYLSLIIAVWLILNPAPSEKGSIQIEITNIRDTRGVVRVGLFEDESGFPDQDKVSWNKVLTPRKGGLSLTIPDLPPGRYALAIFHDLNNNGKLDKNLLGIPTEPYGFSGTAKGKWSTPVFEEAAFTLSASGQQLSIPLFRWEER